MMEKDLKRGKCCICLKTGPFMHPVGKAEQNALSLLQKLRSCVPEIAWQGDFVICIQCNSELELVHDFRERCLRSEKLRKGEFPEEKATIEPCNLTADRDLSAKLYPCKLCDGAFKTAAYLKQHLKYHTDVKAEVCSFCGKAFKMRGDLRVHEKTHLNRKEYSCDRCQRSYNTHKGLHTHKHVVHTDPLLWKYACPFCSKRFPMKTKFETHLRRHNNERPHKCHICDKNFFTKYELRAHIDTHTDQRAHTCDICRKDFKNKKNLQVHQKTHTKVLEKTRKHLCHFCPKIYLDKSKLTRHLRQHTGESPFSCHVCGKRFVENCYLKGHLARMHSVVEITENV